MADTAFQIQYRQEFIAGFEQDGDIPPPLCVFCSAPWTDEMLRAYAEADVPYGDYGEVNEIDITIDVTCSSCKRLVYRKHVSQIGNHWGG